MTTYPRATTARRRSDGKLCRGRRWDFLLFPSLESYLMPLYERKSAPALEPAES